MIAFVLWLLLTLAVAAGVLVAAAVATSDRPEAGRGLTGFLNDVRAGLDDIRVAWHERRSNTRAPRTGVGYADETEASLEEFFTSGQQQGDGYMDAAEIGATLDRARAVVRRRTGSVPLVPAPPSGVTTTPHERRPRSVSGHHPASGLVGDSRAGNLRD